jgi:hypothetical protein
MSDAHDLEVLKEFLEHIDLNDVYDTLLQHGFDSLDVLSVANEGQLVKMCDIKIGHALKIVRNLKSRRAIEQSE